MRSDADYLSWNGRHRIGRKAGFHDPKRLNALLDDSGADALIVTSADNVAYLSNFDTCAARIIFSPVAVIVSRRAEASFLVFPIYELADFVECAPADVKPWCYSAGRFRYFTSRAPQESHDAVPPLDVEVSRLAADVPCSDDAEEAIAGVLNSLALSSASTIAIDDGGLPFAMRQKLRSIVAGARLIDGEELMRKLRATKTPVEISLLEKASEINNRAMAKAVQLINPGVTERQLANAFSASVAADGAEVSWVIIKAGPGAALTHAHSTDYALRPGDLVRFELGCRYSGYYSDVGRTYVVGRASEEQTYIYQSLRAGFFAAVESLRPGTKARDVFRSGIQAVHAAGFREYERGFIGHGCGTYLYDRPFLAEGSEDLIEPGMVLAVELPFYRIGFGGMQIEAQVVVDGGRSRVLGDIPESLSLPD